jgi:hypothetical protein
MGSPYGVIFIYIKDIYKRDPKGLLLQIKEEENQKQDT